MNFGNRLFGGRSAAELKALIILSAPLIAAHFSQCAMGFVDTVMAGRVSSVDLAAVAMGSSIWFSVFLFMLGILMAVTPSVAQLHGAGKGKEIGHHVRQALLLALALSVALIAILRNAAPLLSFMEVDAAAAPLTVAYLKALSWGVPAIAVFFVLRHFSEALSCTKPSMIVAFVGLAFNIAANYILIYGKLGFPAMGGVGCGWASALTMWVMCLGMIVIVLRGKIFAPARLTKGGFRPDVNELGRILRLGLPIGCALFVEASIFGVIALLIGSLGADVVAAHQIALNFASLVFMVPLSVSTAISVRVGHAIGRQSPRDARRSSAVGIVLTAFLALFSAAFTLLFPGVIASIYTDNADVAAAAAALLVLAALFQVSDAVQVSTAGALRGYKDTRVPMYLLIFAYWAVGLPLGYTLGLTSLWGEPMGAAGFWIGLIAGLTAAAVLLSWRLRVLTRRFDTKKGAAPKTAAALGTKSVERLGA